MYDKLIKAAWEARGKAYPWKSGTKVGCAIMDDQGNIYQGWNIEGLWMTSIHAEVCAISQLAGSGNKGMFVVVVADTEKFTPCGACLDWLIQFCEEHAVIVVQNTKGTILDKYLKDLYPNYPKR